jgi:hypothetical protein
MQMTGSAVDNLPPARLARERMNIAYLRRVMPARPWPSIRNSMDCGESSSNHKRHRHWPRKMLTPTSVYGHKTFAITRSVVVTCTYIFYRLWTSHVVRGHLPSSTVSSWCILPFLFCPGDMELAKRDQKLY